MSINIYKQHKTAIKADVRGEKKHYTPWKWRQLSLGLALISVIKSKEQIISDRLMELHHALGQCASAERFNNGGGQGVYPMTSGSSAAMS